MKKRIAIAFTCIALICCFTACNLGEVKLGGLVGELFEDAELPGLDIFDSFVPVTPMPEPDHDVEETYTMGPGEQLYGFPDNLVLPQDVIMFEATDGLDLGDATSAEVVQQATVAMEQQFTQLYGYEIYHKKTLDGAQIIELAASETQAGTGALMLCYLPVSAAGEVAMSGAFHSNQSLADFELDNGCWFDYLNKDLGFDGVQYSFAGYMTPFAQLDVDCLVYNDDMMRELGYDLYGAVNSREWIFSEYLRLCTMATMDLNGNETLDKDDRFGAVYDQDTRADFMLGNSGVEIFTDCLYGEETLSKCVTLYEDFAGLCRETYEADNAWEVFRSGNSLFYATDLCRFAGLDGKDPMCTYTEFPACVAPMPMYISTVRYVANCDRGSFLSIARSATGDAGMALNVLAVLAVNHIQPSVKEWLYKVNPTDQSISMCLTVMESAHCDLDLTVLAAAGHEVKPLREGAASYMQAYKTEFVKCLKEIYAAARNNR